MLAGPSAFTGRPVELGARAIHLDQDTLTIGVATDGSAAQVRALLDEIDPQGAAVQRFAVHGATLDDVFLALTGHAATTAEQQGGRQEKETVSVSHPTRPPLARAARLRPLRSWPAGRSA